MGGASGARANCRFGGVSGVGERTVDNVATVRQIPAVERLVEAGRAVEHCDRWGAAEVAHHGERGEEKRAEGLGPGVRGRRGSGRGRGRGDALPNIDVTLDTFQSPMGSSKQVASSNTAQGSTQKSERKSFLGRRASAMAGRSCGGGRRDQTRGGIGVAYSRSCL